MQRRDGIQVGKSNKFKNANDGLHAFPKIPAKEVNLQNREEIDININDFSNFKRNNDNNFDSNNAAQNDIAFDEISLIDYPKLNWKAMGNYEITPSKRHGVGEYGVPVRNTPDEKEKVDATIKEFGFNMVNSDKISLDRLPKDLRHEEFSKYIYIYIWLSGRTAIYLFIIDISSL